MAAPFPRSAAYDEAWVTANRMGPNVLWLAESLTQRMPLAEGERVLDLGCGKAISSIFLAREFGAEVWATDLWIKPAGNLERIREAGLEGRVHPLYAEARALPYADGFFDAIVSLDAWHYFGTDDFYLQEALRFLRPGGRLGIVSPAFRRELGPDDVPVHLAEVYRQPGIQGWHCFHSPAWWRDHWRKTGLVEAVHADEPPEADAIWAEFVQHTSEDEHPPLLADAAGPRLLTFARVTARKPEADATA